MNKTDAKILALNVFADNVDILIESDIVSSSIKTQKDSELINIAFDELSESLRKRAEKLMSSNNKHCSDCEHFWSNPQCAQMYCCKLQKKITARKKPCKYYKNYYTKDGNR